MCTICSPARFRTNLPRVLREGGVIADGYDADLDELRALTRDAGSFLLELETRERARSGINTLKVEYNKVHGFYIEVSRAQSGNVPDDYRRRQTLKNAERYITPELKAFEDKALSAQERALAREKALFEALLDSLTPHVPDLLDIAAALAETDVLASQAERSRTLKLCAPAFGDEPGILIRAGRHPVVEAQVAHFIPNDVKLSRSRQMLLITGPNMGGKSTYMRQVALITLLACCGLWVPADSARIGAIDRIFTRIGASDDLAGGRSTFMVEMTETAHILHNASNQSLVLLDEIGRGTSTFDGLALAWAVARHLLTATRAFTLFATHYFELTQLAQEFRQAANVHLDAGRARRRPGVSARGGRRPRLAKLRHPGRAPRRRAQPRHPCRTPSSKRTRRRPTPARPARRPLHRPHPRRRTAAPSRPRPTARTRPRYAHPEGSAGYAVCAEGAFIKPAR